jgi:hypothetical protein
MYCNLQHRAPAHKTRTVQRVWVSIDAIYVFTFFFLKYARVLERLYPVVRAIDHPQYINPNRERDFPRIRVNPSSATCPNAQIHAHRSLYIQRGGG